MTRSSKDLGLFLRIKSKEISGKLEIRWKKEPGYSNSSSRRSVILKPEEQLHLSCTLITIESISKTDPQRLDPYLLTEEIKD